MKSNSDRNLAASITKAASQQTYYTIRLLVDPDRVPQAFKAYAYFRWVDDSLDGDQPLGTRTADGSERSAFLSRQRSIMDRCYRGDPPGDVTVEERMLVDLIRTDQDRNIGLQSYIRNMMAVMDFDAGRRGRLISREELTAYSRALATAVTESLHYFIGHGCSSPRDETRYLAVTAAHITHMLRDTLEDLDAGYYNIPEEFLKAQGISPFDVDSKAYQIWVQSRVRLARAYFETGRSYLARVENTRCRLAGHAYTARFERVLDTIERDGYQLRAEYQDCNNLGAVLRTNWPALLPAFNPYRNAGSTVSSNSQIRFKSLAQKKS